MKVKYKFRAPPIWNTSSQYGVGLRLSLMTANTLNQVVDVFVGNGYFRAEMRSAEIRIG